LRDADRRTNALWFYVTAAVAVLADQVAKFLARAHLTYDEPVRVIPGFFDLRLSYNLGGAFGLGAVPEWAPLFIIVALVAIFAIVRLRRAGSSRIVSFGLGMLMGGALGNLIDRLASPDHAVTDFVSLHVSYRGETHAWPTFNIADTAIVVGALVLLFYVYGVERRDPHPRSDAPSRSGREPD